MTLRKEEEEKTLRLLRPNLNSFFLLSYFEYQQYINIYKVSKVK